MRSLLVLGFSLLLSIPCLADATGSWTGWVYWTFEGSGSKCFSSLKITETSDSFHREGGNIECDFSRMDLGDLMLQKVGDRLSLEGTEIGNWTENTYHWSEQYSETVYIKNEIIIKGNSMDYHEKWMHVDGREIYDIKGRFFRP